MKETSISRYVVVIIVVAAVLAFWQFELGPAGENETRFDERASGDIIAVEGTVIRVLSDDLEGSRHQRFIIQLPTGATLLVAHNIDLAPRVADLEEGESVSVKGEYEWNQQGGVVHWTHRDPDGTHEGGWIRYRGETYE